jgi:galactokinase/mevalonate kinase-like predicted kinase
MANAMTTDNTMMVRGYNYDWPQDLIIDHIREYKNVLNTFMKLEDQNVDLDDEEKTEKFEDIKKTAFRMAGFLRWVDCDLFGKLSPADAARELERRICGMTFDNIYRCADEQ